VRQDAAEILSPRQDAEAKETLRRAVFLDRDGTLIEHVHYLADPAHVRLLPGAAEALKRLGRAGFVRVLVTNQSAIGRGMITEARLHEIHAEMNRQLAERGTALDAIYYCPDIPAGDDRTKMENHNRKPGPGMLLRAADELGLDLTASWMVGDLISDVLAGLGAGCRSVMVASGQTQDISANHLVETTHGRYLTAPDFAFAADLILNDRGVR
jgi:D-glycero-D-manno-heptose 1,7-bisphosphate phosphatase